MSTSIRDCFVSCSKSLEELSFFEVVRTAMLFWRVATLARRAMLTNRSSSTGKDWGQYQLVFGILKPPERTQGSGRSASSSKRKREPKSMADPASTSTAITRVVTVPRLRGVSSSIEEPAT